MHEASRGAAPAASVEWIEHTPTRSTLAPAADLTPRLTAPSQPGDAAPRHRRAERSASATARPAPQNKFASADPAFTAKSNSGDGTMPKNSVAAPNTAAVA